LWERVDLEDLDVALDHGDVAGVAQPQPHRSRRSEVPAGGAIGRGREKQRLTVPVEGQGHEIRRTVPGRGCDPYVDVMGQPVLGVEATLSAGAG
jgi:hypothetical protein